MTAGQMSAREEWRNYWGVVLAGFLGTSLVTLPSITLGLFMDPLEQDFGWTRAQISFGLTIFAIVTTPLGPFAGALADRYGSRRIAIPGTLLNGLFLAAFGMMTGLYWQFVTIWALYSSTLLLMRSTVWNKAATSCFTVSRGLALALMIGGISLAQTAAPVITQWLIADHGWRAAYFALGLGWGGVTLLVAVLWFREPRDRLKTGAAADKAAPQPLPAPSGQSFGTAIRDPRIIRIALAGLLQAVIGGGILVHLFPLLTGQGIAREGAAGILAVMGLAALGGQTVTGILSDRVKSTLLPMSCFFVPAMAFALLLYGSGSIVMLTLGVICAGYGMASCVMIVTYLASRYGGVANFGKIHGIISAGFGLGGGLGPFIAGSVFDASGSYDAFLTASILVALLNVALVLRLGPYPDFGSTATTGETAHG
jgi:MFS family permease